MATASRLMVENIPDFVLIKEGRAKTDYFGRGDSLRKTSTGCGASLPSVFVYAARYRMRPVKSKRQLLTALFIIVIFAFQIAPRVQDYIFRLRNKGAVAQQIERERSRVPHLSEGEVLTLAKTEARRSEGDDCEVASAVFLSRAESWEVTMTPPSNFKEAAHASKPVTMWVDDVTRFVSRSPY